MEPIKTTLVELFTLPEGPVIITFPERLSPNDYIDLEQQFELILRRLKRQIGQTDGTHRSPDSLHLHHYRALRSKM